MIRYASLKRLERKKKNHVCPSGISLNELLNRIHERIKELVTIQYAALTEQILPGLREAGMYFLRPGMYSATQSKFVLNLFQNEIFSVLTPVKVIEGKRFPLAGNKRLYAAFELLPFNEAAGERESKVAVLQIPPSLDRLIILPDDEGRICFSLLEDILLSNAGLLFPGFAVQSAVLFRVTRDADLGVDEERDEDFLEAMEEVIVNREHSAPVRIEISDDGSPALRSRLVRLLHLQPEGVYSIHGPLDLHVFWGLVELPGFDRLRFEPWRHQIPVQLSNESDLWDLIGRQDVLLHHPYDSFEPVIRLISEAAHDPKVLAIKMTLYRTSGSSPIVKALEEAAENGKQVTVLVELKARFDEERNISWAQRLERAGGIVVYGIAKLKVHAKALLVVRREVNGIKRYVHLSTGNYNDKTARLYTDIGIFTSKEDITYETSLFFNAITGYASVPVLRKLTMAPIALKDRIISLIDREAERSSPDRPGIIMAKMNALADIDVIRALYHAAKRGTQIFLNIRGVCMLMPGIEGVSDSIHVVSIIDRYLEHSRILYFLNGGDEEVYLSSADWMSRNLERRVELMFPVEQDDLKHRITNALKIFFQDNRNAYLLRQDGRYLRLSADTETSLRAQAVFQEKAAVRADDNVSVPGKDFNVRRKPPKF